MTGQDLKNSILQLAIQGKLVPQNPDDEPASVLLERIKAEKKKLIEEKKIKKEKPLAEITEDEKPFDIPDCWVWVRLGNCVSADCSLSYGIVQPMNDVSGGVPVVRPVDMNTKFINTQGLKRVSPDISESYQRTILKGNEILFCVRGTVGKISIASKELNGANVTRGISPIRFDNEEQKYYCFYCLQSSFLITQIEHYTKGAALKQINIEDLKNLLIPLPPLSEQKRIVAKIEELMPLVDEYDKAQKELDALNSAMPEKLKQSILQEAIMGKLCTNNPDDEPASELLKRIRKEKEQLIKGKKIKKEKPLPEITDEEKTFDIPDNWVWCRWGDLSFSIQYGYNASAQQNGDIRMVRISDIQNNEVLWDSVPYCKIKAEEIEGYLLKPNDILFARTGGTVGKSFLVKKVPYPSIYAGYLIRTRYSNNLVPQYLKYFMESRLYWEQLREGTIATAQPNCNGKTLGNMRIPLPPLAEQHRIVSKIENLFACIEPLAKDVK